MANKDRYYGLATQGDKNAVTFGGSAYPENGGILSYGAVTTAVRNYKATHSNFDQLSTQVAAQRIARELTETGLYGNVTAQGSRIYGKGYSVSLTSGTRTGGIITVSRASERIGEESDQRRRKG